jgi:Kef-type K+ transport system membrane component KefB
MELILTLVFCIAVSLLFTLLARKLNLSVVIGLIVAGVFMGSSFMEQTFLEPNTEFIFSLGDVGFIFLMFLAGLEVSWSMLYKERKDAAYVASFAALIPFALGFTVFTLMGYSPLTSMTVGICMGITAEATKARILLELKKLKTKIGSLMMGAGIIDDIIGMSLFTMISYLFTGTFVTKELVMLIAAISAFFIGITVHRFIGRYETKMVYAEKFLLLFIVPFFFISMGIYFKSHSLIQNPVILLTIIAIAISGKMLGSLLTKPFTRMKLKQLYLVGWGMNSRGAVELALAFLAFRIGLINTEIYSALIVMALATTLMFPFFVTRMVKKEPGIMS